MNPATSISRPLLLRVVDSLRVPPENRAVLSRGGKAFDLTEDHKPDAPREIERIYRCYYSTRCYAISTRLYATTLYFTVIHLEKAGPDYRRRLLMTLIPVIKIARHFYNGFRGVSCVGSNRFSTSSRLSDTSYLRTHI